MTSDFLLFETDDREPDDRLRYQFEAISRMPMDEQELVRGLLDAVIVKHHVAGALLLQQDQQLKGRSDLKAVYRCITKAIHRAPAFIRRNLHFA